jgi:hypothetical protein
VVALRPQMAEKPQPSGADDAPLDLSDLNFGPSWARDKSEPKERKEYKEYKERPQGGRGGDRRGPHGGGGGGGGGQQRREGGQRNFDNRDRNRDRGRGQGGGNFDSRERRQREEVPAPADVNGQVLPGEEGMDALAKEVLGGGRTYSVFDLAKVVMSARERFNVGFKSTGSVVFFRCKKDGAVWLTKAEALGHFSRSEWRKEFYQEIITDAGPPKGNFQAVAVCGMSNEILGPPNYHGYQTALMQLHRERFSNMPIDRYKSKVRMERSEEAVNAWLEKMSKQMRYLPLAQGAEKKVEEVKTAPSSEESAVDLPSEESVPENSEEAEVKKEIPETEEATSEAPTTEEAPVEDAAVEAPVSEEAVPAYDPSDLLADVQAVERHFAENYFKDVYVESNRVWVGGGIPGNQISPGLLTLLRETVSEERRYPGKLTPMLCRQLSGRHVAVFKWQKKLKVGPSRPHEVPDDIKLAERPQSLLDWVKGNSGGTLETLWSALLPADVTDALKHEWYHDLHWLLNQGYILLLADSTLHLSKKPGGSGGGNKPKKKASKKKSSAKGKAETPGGSESVTGDTPEAVAAEPEAVAAEPEAVAAEPEAGAPESEAITAEPEAVSDESKSEVSGSEPTDSQGDEVTS